MILPGHISSFQNAAYKTTQYIYRFENGLGISIFKRPFEGAFEAAIIYFPEPFVNSKYKLLQKHPLVDENGGIIVLTNENMEEFFEKVKKITEFEVSVYIEEEEKTIPTITSHIPQEIRVVENGTDQTPSTKKGIKKYFERLLVENRNGNWGNWGVENLLSETKDWVDKKYLINPDIYQFEKEYINVPFEKQEYKFKNINSNKVTTKQFLK